MYRSLPKGELPGYDKVTKGDTVLVHFEGKVVKTKRDAITIRLRDEHNKSGWRQVTIPADLVQRLSALQQLAQQAE